MMPDLAGWDCLFSNERGAGVWTRNQGRPEIHWRNDGSREFRAAKRVALMWMAKEMAPK